MFSNLSDSSLLNPHLTCHLVVSNFSFSHNVFKICLLLMRENEYLWSKGYSSLKSIIKDQFTTLPFFWLGGGLAWDTGRDNGCAGWTGFGVAGFLAVAPSVTDFKVIP